MAKRTMDQAIRAYCLQCANHSKKEVEFCPIIKCPLYPYRLGKDQEDHHLPDENRAEIDASVQPILFE